MFSVLSIFQIERNIVIYMLLMKVSLMYYLHLFVSQIVKSSIILYFKDRLGFDLLACPIHERSNYLTF